MIKLAEFKKVLSENLDRNIRFVLPTGTTIPLHAHVTDVARIEKRFIDCGGTFRTEVMCRLQVWFADDTEHRISTKMLFKVLEKSAPFLETEDLDIDVEYEAPFISQFPIESVEVDNTVLVVRLGVKHTTCLAPDQCLPPAARKDTLSFKPFPTLQPSKCC